MATPWAAVRQALRVGRRMAFLRPARKDWDRTLPSHRGENALHGVSWPNPCAITCSGSSARRRLPAATQVMFWFGILDVAGFAVDAILRVDHELRARPSSTHS